jgi:hypothetical protein
MFTFCWNQTIETIKFYQRGKMKHNIEVGGILASLLKEDVEAETGIKPHFGLWDEVDKLPPDYSLTNSVYGYALNNASIAYMTKGCRNNCAFCAVPFLEPQYVDFIPLKEQLSEDKRDLILLDNNVLASSQFPEIIKEIKRCGFKREARHSNAYRHVDFNQGLDARYLSEDKMALLGELPLKPLRIAFDDVKYEKLYTEKIRLAHKYGIKNLSNYILFNFEDIPDDFYYRLRLNIELNEELGLSIFSFPMKYVPLHAKDRKYIGSNWTKTQLRGIQCILHATHGVVGPKKSFFEAAFGHNVKEFKYIIEQPEEAIFYRSKMEPFEPIKEFAVL